MWKNSLGVWTISTKFIPDFEPLKKDFVPEFYQNIKYSFKPLEIKHENTKTSKPRRTCADET